MVSCFINLCINIRPDSFNSFSRCITIICVKLAMRPRLFILQDHGYNILSYITNIFMI